MSLVAWYRLNGDYTNCGVGDANLTVTTNPTYVDSQFGKSMTTGGFRWTAEQTAKIFNNDELSISFWIYPNAAEDTSGSWRIVGNDGGDSGRQFTMFLYPTINDLHWSWTNIGSGVAYDKIPSYKWSHVVITYKNPLATFYVNGVAVGTMNKAAAYSSFEYLTTPMGASYSNILRSDYRFYNHCLSTKEIKELGKGLITHLPLDWGANPNLVYKSNYKYEWDYSTITTTKGILFWQSAAMTLETGVNYTISFDAKIDTDDDTLCNGLECDLYPDQLPQRNFQFTVADGLTNKWKHFTWTTSSTQERMNNCTLRFFIDFQDSTTGNTVNAPIHVRNIKLEKGTIDTPWIPHTSDPNYSKFLLGQNIKNECSGYGLSLTQSGTIECDNDTPRGNSCINFNQSGYLYSTTYNKTLSMFTVAFWIKVPASITEQHFVLGTFNNWTNNGLGIWRDTSATSYSVLLRDSSASTHGTIKTPAFTANTWYHVAITWDGTTINQYINGALDKTAAYGSNGTCSMPVIYLGTSVYSNKLAQETDECSLSDFRVYCTALSADDIKELYTISASISNNSKLLGRKIIENNLSKISKKDIQSYGYIENDGNSLYTVVGSPTIKNGVFSNMTYQNCINLPFIDFKDKKFSIYGIVNFVTADMSLDRATIFGINGSDYKLPLLSSAKGKFHLHYGNGSSWAYNADTSFTFTAGTDYLVGYEVDGSYITFKVNNQTIHRVAYAGINYDLGTTTYRLGAHSPGNNWQLKGSIRDVSIKVEDNIVWRSIDAYYGNIKAKIGTDYISADEIIEY